MMREGSETLGEAFESLTGILGGIALGFAVGAGIARLVPGASSLHNIGPFFLIGATLLVASYLPYRRRALLLGRAAQALMWSVFIGIPLLFPALMKSPGQAAAWLAILVLSSVGVALYRIAPRLRTAIEHELA